MKKNILSLIETLIDFNMNAITYQDDLYLPARLLSKSYYTPIETTNLTLSHVTSEVLDKDGNPITEDNFPAVFFPNPHTLEIRANANMPGDIFPSGLNIINIYGDYSGPVSPITNTGTFALKLWIYSIDVVPENLSTLPSWSLSQPLTNGFQYVTNFAVSGFETVDRVSLTVDNDPNNNKGLRLDWSGTTFTLKGIPGNITIGTHTINIFCWNIGGTYVELEYTLNVIA